MKAPLSPLTLIDFAIVNSNFRFISPPGAINIKQVAATYEIDIDFAILADPDSTNTRIFIKTAINNVKEPKPGYSIFAEGVGVYRLSNDAALSEEDKQSLLQFSAVSITLNSLRGFISSLTSNAPLGRYILPSIDVISLFRQKAQSIEEVKPKK